jgi:membrane protease YdiL (CAAX protease family)
MVESLPMNIKAFIQRHPVAVYFALAFLISWGSGLVVLVPKLIRGNANPLDALLLFPILVIGVALTGIVLTGIVDGRSGLRNLFSRIGLWRVGIRWYAAIFIPPVLITIVLLTFSILVSVSFTPNFFPIGLLYGIFPGFFEEIGWMGFAFPKMQLQYSPLTAAIFLGVLWGLWHLPVVDSLGAAVPHKIYWLPFFLAFIALVAAVRVLIAWVYTNTRSLLLAQLMHVSTTASLVILGPPRISPAQEALWYAVYAAVLWIVVAIVAARYGKRLTR